MLEIVAVMAGGIGCGYLLRKRRTGWTGRCITAAIWLLLFLLGISVGGNEAVMGQLDTIGLQALVLSAAAVTGSVVCSAVVYRRFFRHHNGNEGK